MPEPLRLAIMWHYGDRKRCCRNSPIWWASWWRDFFDGCAVTFGRRASITITRHVASPLHHATAVGRSSVLASPHRKNTVWKSPKLSRYATHAEHNPLRSCRFVWVVTQLADEGRNTRREETDDSPRWTCFSVVAWQTCRPLFVIPWPWSKTLYHLQLWRMPDTHRYLNRIGWLN